MSEIILRLVEVGATGVVLTGPVETTSVGLEIIAGTFDFWWWNVDTNGRFPSGQSIDIKTIKNGTYLSAEKAC